MKLFEEMGLSNELLEAVAKMGFEAATAIQDQTIPIALKGKDIIGQAQTGTGKTAAFGIPMVERMDKVESSVSALVVTPTRELAIQVSEELNSLGQVKGIRALPIYGGQDIVRQMRALKNRPHIIVGTPGRLMDHMRRGTLRLKQVNMVVLDEADEMLNMGFIEDIETILKEVPGERQTMLFSATMPVAIQNLARRFMKNPEFIKIQTREVTVPNTEQHYIEVQEKQKFDVLCRLLDLHSPKLAIVFGRTKRRVDELHEALHKRGYSAEAIHGDLTQSKRDSVMQNFRRGTTEILVATDVAARGLDISDVSHVYNFDVPQDPESYVHRIGRTGRLGKAGIATTFVTTRELYHLRLIENTTKRKIIRQQPPTFSEVLEGQQRIAIEKLLQVAQEDLRQYKKTAESLLEDRDSVTLLSAALKIMTREPDVTPVTLTEEASMRQKRPKETREAAARPAWRRDNYKGVRSGKRENRMKYEKYGKHDKNKF